MGVAAVRKASHGPGEVVAEMAAGFRDNRLLTYASAIAFQTTMAIPPFLLFGLGLLGFLQLEELWRDDLAPDLRDNVSASAFALVDDTVRKVLGEKQLSWITAGAAFALWEVSGAIRAVMGALDEIYSDHRPRTLRQTLVPSLLLAAGVGACLLAALAVVRIGPLFFVLRWLAAALLVALAVGLLVHFAPKRDQPLPWVSFGTLLVIVAWIAMSIGFGFYVSQIASYGSIFGHLATFFVGLLYLYVAAAVFLGGLQLDAVVRRRVGEG